MNLKKRIERRVKKGGDVRIAVIGKNLKKRIESADFEAFKSCLNNALMESQKED